MPLHPVSMPTGGRLALIADSDSFLRSIARECLARLGLELVETSDGRQLLELIEAREPELILLDARLPGLDGIGVCEELRRRPGSVDTPILLMTEANDAEAIARGFEAGATDILQKPVREVVLTHRAGRLLDRIDDRLALEQSREEFARVRRIAGIAIWDCDVESGELYAADEVRVLFRLAPVDGPVTFDQILERIHPDDREALRNAFRKGSEHCSEPIPEVMEDPPGGFGLDTRVVLSATEECVVHWQGEVVQGDDGAPLRVAGILQDVTERRHAEAQIRHMAFRDGLTGLTNRHAFMERLADAVSQGKRYDRHGALMFLDLDNFKRVNDTLGHAAGDQLLKDMAERLDACLRTTDYITRGNNGRRSDVSRLGGDEFTVLLTELASGQDAARVAQRILEVLREPFSIARNDVVVGASIGITVFPSDGNDVDTLLQNADAAMYMAKEKGRNGFQFFTEAIHKATERKISLEQRLSRAFENHELTVFYQPQVETDTGRIRGVEALLRWEDPELGAVSPAEFIPLAEAAGLITPIGEWVLRTACWQAKAWRDAGLAPVRLAINISPHHFTDDALVEAMNLVLLDTGLDPETIELEITEHALMKNQDAVVSILKQLKRIGVSIALDDFGTGYSSLSYLKRFPVDTVKIDRSFVRDVSVDRDDAAITRAIIGMAKALRLRVIAEGVETEIQRQFLSAGGCDEMQGYLFSPPVTADALAEMLRGED